MNIIHNPFAQAVASAATSAMQGDGNATGNNAMN